MMEALLEEVSDFSASLKRNIINLSTIHHAFDDLVKQPSMTTVAESLILETRKNMNFSNKLSDFYYTAAILYPFESEPFIATRYSDGSFPVWYGSLDMTTTIYETVYHMRQSLIGIEGIEQEEVITRERSVFNVHCQGLLIDVSHKQTQYPELVSKNDYRFCQTLAKRLVKSHCQGLLSPSARCAEGVNANIFSPEVLSQARLYKNLCYQFDTSTNTVTVLDKGRVLLSA